MFCGGVVMTKAQLKAKMKATGLSQAELARKINCYPYFISKLINKPLLISSTNSKLMELADIIGVSRKEMSDYIDTCSIKRIKPDDIRDSIPYYPNHITVKELAKMHHCESKTINDKLMMYNDIAEDNNKFCRVNQDSYK